jgi:nitrate/nitrite-specific signal transduction histidine kinase
MAPKRTHTRLRTRILMWSFIPTTIILFAVAATLYFAYQRVTADLVVGRNQQLIRLSAGELSADLNTYVNALSSLTRTPDLYAEDWALQSTALRQASNQLLIFDGGTLILDRFGRVVTAEPDHPGLVGQDWSSRSFFRQILRAGQPAFSDTLSASWLDSAVVGVAVPIMNAQGEFRGTLVGMFRLGASSASAFYGSIVKLRLGGNGSTYLVDSGGHVIYHPDESLIGTDLHAQPVVMQVLKGQVGSLRTRGLDNRDILATYAPVPGTPWGLINEEDWAGLLATSQGYGQFLSLLLGLGVIVPIILVLLGVRRITEPIAQFIAAAKEIAGGKYGQQITVSTGDELEELGNQFNQMSIQLSESYAQLEQRVAARTRELATLNAIAAVASRSLNLDEILNNALEKILDVLGMEWGSAYAIDDEGATLRLLAQHGLPQDFVDRISPRTLKGSVVEEAALTGHPRVWHIGDYPEVAFKPFLERGGIDQVIGVPLMVKGRLVGAFIFGALRARPISSEELALLDASGQQIAIAVENARLYRQAEETAAVAERTRLARELHDSVTQSLYSVTLFAEASARLLAMSDYTNAAENLRELRDTAQEALQEMRLLIFELRPSALEHQGLAAALQARLDAVERRGGARGELHIAGEDHLSPLMQAELYHIAQEALNNTLKHAHAQRVDIHLLFSEIDVKLQIRDDGIGFNAANPSRGGQGLAGMRERAQRIGGDLSVESTTGRGTTVTFQAQLRSQAWKPLLQQGDPT